MTIKFLFIRGCLFQNILPQRYTFLVLPEFLMKTLVRGQVRVKFQQVTWS